MPDAVKHIRQTSLEDLERAARVVGIEEAALGRQGAVGYNKDIFL